MNDKRYKRKVKEEWEDMTEEEIRKDTKLIEMQKMREEELNHQRMLEAE